MTKNNSEEQNYKKRKKSSDKVDDSSVSLPSRPTLCWSKLNRNENIVPRFPKLQQRSSKLRIKGMTTILEESLAVLNPPKMPSNSSITNSNISNTITDPSATSNDVDSLTLASTNEISPYPQSFTVFPLSMQLSHFFLGNQKKSTGSIKKIPRRRRSDLSLSDLSSTSVSIMERRPSILQCILSEVFNNGKDKEVEGLDKMNGESKNKKNDVKKNKEIIKKESDSVLRPKSVERRKCDKKEIFDEREVETKVQKEIGDNVEVKRDKKNIVGKFKGEGQKKEEYENDMGRVEKELRRREYAEMCRITREIRESREKESRASRELNKKIMDKYKSSRGCSRETNKSYGKRSRNKSKNIDKCSRETERRDSSDRYEKGKENTDSRKKNKKRLNILQRKTKSYGTMKRELESEEKKKLIKTNTNNDFKKKLDDIEVKEDNKKDKRINNLNKESKADDPQRKRRIYDCRSTKSKDTRYESEVSDDEIEVQKKIKWKDEITENEKHRNRENVIDFKEEGNEKNVNIQTEKIEKQIIVEKENGRLFEKQNSVMSRNERGNRKKVVEIDEGGKDDKFEIKNDKDSRENNRKIKNKEKHLEKKEKMHEGSRRKNVAKVNKSKESREKYKNKEKNEIKKVDDRENNKSRIEKHDRKLAASKIQKHLKNDILDVNKIERFQDNEKELKDFKFSEELKNMNKDLRGKRNKKSAKKEKLFVGDAGEGVLDHKANIPSHKPAEASKSEDTASYNRDNSFVKIKKSLKQFAEYSKHKLENKISSFSVNGNRNMHDSPRKHRFTRKPDKINVTINRTSNMQKVLQQNEACYKNLYSCENLHQVSKLKPTIRLEDLGSLKIPPFKPKSPSKINIDVQSEGDHSGNSIISPQQSTGWNSSAVASTSLMIISDFSETEYSNASRKISFRDMIQELCSKPMLDRFPSFPINPYCFMTFNNYKRKHINKGTNTEITWTRDELKVNLHSPRGISKAKIKVPQYQTRKVIMKNKTVNQRKRLSFQSPHEIQNSRIPVIKRDVSLSSETSSKLDEISEAEALKRNPTMKSVSTPNNINYQEIKTTLDKTEEVKDMKIEHNQELIVKYDENLVQKKESSSEYQSQSSTVEIQEQKSDVQTANKQHFENQSSVPENCNLIDSMSASEHIRNIEEEVYDFSDETDNISKKKKNRKSRWYLNLFSRSSGDGKRITEEIIEDVAEDVSDKKKFNSKIARPKSIRSFKDGSTKIVEEEDEVEEKCAVGKKLEQDAAGSLESLAAALKEKTRLSFEAELRKIEEDFLIYKCKNSGILDNDLKSDSNLFGEILKSEEFIKKESLEIKTQTTDDTSQPIVTEEAGTISPKVPPRSHKTIPPKETAQPTRTKKVIPMYRTQIPRKLPPLPPKDFPENSNFINNEALLINMMNEQTKGFLPNAVKLSSSVSLISIKGVDSKTHSVSLQVMVPSKAVETSTSKSLIVGKPTKKSRLPLRIKNRNEKKRVDGVNSFTFPIEIDLKKAMAEVESSGNVNGFDEASDYVAPSGQDLNCSLSHIVTSKFGSYMKRVKSFFVGQPNSSIASIELKISDYQSVCSIFDERLRLRQISSSESDLPNYFKQQTIIAALTTKAAPLSYNKPLKEVPNKYKKHIPIDIEGFLYFIFKSLLRKYLEEEIALKAMVPCTLGQQYKAPKLSDSILVDPNPILNKVSSIQCKYDEMDMRNAGVVKNITITVEDVENDDYKLPPYLKRLKDIQIKNEYIFEIVYDDLETVDMEDKYVQTDFEEEEVEEEEEEIELSDKEVQTDIDEWDDDFVEVISIALQTDDEDNLEIFSTSITLDNSSDEEDLVEVISIALQTDGEEDVIETKSASIQFDGGSKKGDNLVEGILIAIPSDGEDNVASMSTSTQFDDSSVNKKENEIGGGDSNTEEKYSSKDKKNLRFNKMEEQESETIRESEFDGTTDSITDNNSLTNGKNNSTAKLEETEYEDTTEDNSNVREASSSNLDEYKETTKDNSNVMSKENLEPYAKDQISDQSEDKNDALANSESLTEALIKSSSMETDKIEEQAEETNTSLISGLQDGSQCDITSRDTDKLVEETDKRNRDKKLKESNAKSNLKKILDGIGAKFQANAKSNVRINSHETDNPESSTKEPLESDSAEYITSKNNSNRIKKKLKKNQTKNKEPTEDTTESTELTSSTEIPSLPVRPTRSDDFTLVLEPTQQEVELIISFKDNDLKLILPSTSSRINIVHEEQDMVYELLSILFDNLKENKNFVRKMHKVLQNANKDISNNLFNSKAVARAKEFIRNILDSVIEEEGVFILDAKKILQIEEKYRDICTTSNIMHECAELKKTSYNSILNVDSSNSKRCVCGNMKEHTKSCPCIPKENIKKKRKRVTKDSNELNKAFIVLHAFERRPTSDELSEDTESMSKESNEIELEKSNKSLLKNLHKPSFSDFQPFVEPVSVFRFKEEQVDKNPPILWSLAKKFLRNRRNRNEERKRLTNHRRCESVKSKSFSNRKSKRRSRSSSSSRIGGSSQDPSEESCCSFLCSQSEFLQNANSFASVQGVLLRNLNEEEEEIEKKVEFLYPKCSNDKKACVISSRCFTPSCSSGIIWSRGNIPCKKNIKNKGMDASTSDSEAFLEKDTNNLKNEDFKIQESSKDKDSEENNTNLDDKAILTGIVKENAEDTAQRKKENVNKSKGEKKVKRKRKRSKDVPTSSTPAGPDGVGTGDEIGIHKSEQNILNTAPPISSTPPPSTPSEEKDEAAELLQGKPKGYNVVEEIGTNTIHVPKKIKRKKADKTDKETETEVKVYEPKGDVDVIVVEKPDPKSTGNQHCRLCEDCDDQKREKKKSRKKYFKDDNSLTDPKDKTILSVKEPDENDFKEEPKNTEMDGSKNEAPVVGAKTCPPLCDTLKRITLKKDKLPNDKMLKEKPEKSVDNKVKGEEITMGKTRPTLCDTLKRIASKKDVCTCSNDDKNEKPCQAKPGKSGEYTKGAPKDKVITTGKLCPTLCDNLKRITSKKDNFKGSNVDKNGKPLVLLSSDMPLDEIDKLLSKILTPENKTDLAKKLVPAFSESSIPPNSNSESLKKHNSVPNIKPGKNKKSNIAKDINESKDPTSSKSSSLPSSKKGSLKKNSGPKKKPDKNKKIDVIKDINETKDAILSDSSYPPSSSTESFRNNNSEIEKDKKTNFVDDKSKDSILSESSIPTSSNKEPIKKNNSAQNIKPEENKKTDIVKYINQSKDAILDKLTKTDHTKLGLCEEMFKSFFHKKKPKAPAEVPPKVVSCLCKRDACKTQDLHIEKEQVKKKGVKELNTSPRSQFHSDDDTPAVPTNSVATIQKKQSVQRHPSLLENIEPFASEIAKSDIYTETEPLEENQKVTIDELASENKRKSFVSTASDPIDIKQENEQLDEIRPKISKSEKNPSISSDVDQVAENDQSAVTTDDSPNEEKIEQKELEITKDNKEQLTASKKPEKEIIKGNVSNICACENIHDSSGKKKRNSKHNWRIINKDKRASNLQDAPTQTNKAYVESEEKDETGTQTSINNSIISANKAEVVSAGINTNKNIEVINEENEETSTQTSANNLTIAATQGKVVSTGINTNKTIGTINDEETGTQTSVNNLTIPAAQVVSAGVNTNKNIGAINEENEETGTQTSVNNMTIAAVQPKVVSAGVNTNKNIGAINEENEETGTQTSVNNLTIAAAQGKVVSVGINTNKNIGVINEENEETYTQTSDNNSTIAVTQPKVVSAGANTNKNIRVINAKVQTSDSLLPATCPAKERTLRNLSSKNPEESLYILRKVQGPIKPKKDCNQIGNILRFIKNMKSPTEQNENKLFANEPEKNKKIELKEVDPSRSIDTAPKTTKPGEKKGCKESCKLIVDDFCGRRQKYGQKKLLNDDKDMTHRGERRNSKDRSTRVIGEGDKGHKRKPKLKTDDHKSSKSGDMPATKIASNADDPYISDTKINNKNDADIHDQGTKKMNIEDDPYLENQEKRNSKPEPHEPDKLKVKRSLDPEPRADEIIKPIEEDDPKDLNRMDIYDIKSKEIEEYETDPDADYDKPIIYEKKPITDFNDTFVDKSLEDIQNDGTPIKDDTPKNNKDEVSNFEKNSIGVQVNLKESPNCNCKTRSSAELLLTPPIEIDKKFCETTDSDTTFPIPNEDRTVVQPNKINEPQIPNNDSLLSKINKLYIGVDDLEPYCLCKNGTKEDSVPKSRESFKKDGDNHGTKTINSKEKKSNTAMSNESVVQFQKNSQVAKESKFKKGCRNLSNIAGSKSNKLKSLLCPSTVNTSTKMLGISPEDICRGQGNSEVIQHNYFTAVHGARIKNQSCGNDQQGIKQTKIPMKENIFFYKNMLSPPKSLATSNKINDNEQNDIAEFDQDIRFINARDSLTVTIERKSVASRKGRNEKNEHDIKDNKYSQNVIQAFTIQKPNGLSVPYDINKYHKFSDISHNSDCESIFEEELQLIKEIQKRSLFKDKRKASMTDKRELHLDESDSDEELKKDKEKKSEMLHDAFIKSCNKNRKRLIKINETDTPSIIARKERGYRIAEGLDFTDSGHEQLRAETFIKNRAKALADILNFDESEFDIKTALKNRNKNLINVERRSMLKTKYNRKSTDYKHSGVRMSSDIELENRKSSQIGEYLDEEGRYHSTLMDIYRPSFKTSISKSNTSDSNQSDIKDDKIESQPTVETSISKLKATDSNKADIEDDKKECKCCNVCKEVNCTCQKPKISNPSLIITAYQEYLSVGIHEEKLKTETILNFDSEDSKGEEITNFSLLKQLLESNLVLSKQNPMNKISEIKVEIDENICVLNEDSMPQGCSSTRLSTIIEKSENETSQKKHTQKHWNKSIKKDILEIGHSVETDKKSVKPKLLGISKFLKNISKAVQRKNSRLQEKNSIFTIFAPRNIADSAVPLVTEVEFGGKKYLVHRGSPSPSGSMECLNSQRTINSDIPSLKSYETPNETEKALTIFENDTEDTSDTNAEYSDVIYTKKRFNNVNDFCAPKSLLKDKNIKSNCDKSCYRLEKKGKDTFHEFWRREGVWNNSTMKKEDEGKGICTEELPRERKISKTFSKNLKTEIIKNVFEMSTNNFSAEKCRKLPNVLGIINSSVLHGKHQFDELPSKNIEKSSQKSFENFIANSELSAKGITVGYRKTPDCKNYANSRNAIFSEHSKMAGISGTSRHIDSDILDSCEKDLSDQVESRSRNKIVKDVIVLPRIIKLAEEMETNSVHEEPVSEDSDEIMGNEELLSLLDNLGKLERITEENSDRSETYLSDDSDNEKDSRTPIILRSKNSNILQSYEKLRPILLENISKESEHYVYKQICSYLDTSSCRPTSDSSSYSTDAQINDTSTKSKLNSSQNSNKQSLGESISRQSKQSSGSYPSIRSRYMKKSNQFSSERNENILSNLLNKEEVIALMMKYRKERILEEARSNSLRKKTKLKNEKRRKHKDNEARKNQKIFKEDKEIPNKMRSDVLINDKKISINIEEMFDKRKVEGCISQETLENGFIKGRKRSIDMLMEDSEMENELHKANKKKVVDKCYNYQRNSNISNSSESNRKFVTFSKDSEEINEYFSNTNYGEFSGYCNENLQEKYAKSNEHFDQFAENKSTSEFTENILGFNSDVKSELSGYTTTNEIKCQNITNDRVSNKSFIFSNVEDSEVSKSCLRSLDISHPITLISSHVSLPTETSKQCRSKFSIKYTTTENSKNGIQSKTKETETSNLNIYSNNKKKKILDRLKIEIIPICDIKGNFENDAKKNISNNSFIKRKEIVEGTRNPQETNVTKALREQRDLDFKETFEREFIINNTRKLKKETSKMCIQTKTSKHQLSSIIETKQNKKISSSIHYNSGLSKTTTNYCGFDTTTEDKRESHNHQMIFEKYRNQKYRNYSFLTSKEEKTSIEDDEYVLAVHNYTTTELLKKVGLTQNQSSKYFATERRSTVISFDENLRPIVTHEERKKVKL